MGFCEAAINISCVGDSITAGVGVTDPTHQSYPAKLQQLLGTNYLVNNFGVSGTTLLFNGDMPYTKTAAYPSSGSRPAPNIVIIMLGSNDSKPQNWVYGTNFVPNYETFIASYTNVSTHPRIVLCTPPPVFNNGYVGINPGIVATNITPLILQLGTNEGLQVVDMQSLLAGHSEWFPDNVHPNSSGTTVMAAIMYTAIAGDTNGSGPTLAVNLLSTNSLNINWPAGGAGWVLQSVQTPGSTDFWSVVSLPAVNNGAVVNVTNPITGPGAFFRLWQPSY